MAKRVAGFGTTVFVEINELARRHKAVNLGQGFPDFAGPLTEAVLLGTVCVRAGGMKMLWDSANLKITNVAEANKYLHYEYRKGFEL